MGKRTSTLGTVLGYAGLLAIGVPWYWQWLPDLAVRTVAGVPLWACVTLVCSVAISALTAGSVARDWPGDEDETAGDAAP